MSYYNAQVAVMGGSNNMVLRFVPHEEPSTTVPYELQPYYPADVWASRIPAVTRTASRYFKKGLEWIWLIVSFAALIAAPVAVYFVALHSLPDDDNSDDNNNNDHDRDRFDDDDRNSFDRYWKARLISFATWIALMVVVFVPMHMWKNHGKRVVNQMLINWENEDRAVRGPNAPLPTLRMKSPGVISKHIKLSVNIPPMAPSMYNPGSNVPPYIANGPMDPAAARYYGQQPPQNVGQWGPPPTSAQATQGGAGFGGVPLYNPHDERVPGYSAPTLAYSDEKNPFEDVKV